jgi:hypothetical protein
MGKMEYKDFVQTLKETSIDTDHKDEQGDNVYMTDSAKEVINFDDFLEAYFKNGNIKARKPESVDAYCLLDGNPCLIEFKNGKVEKEVHGKIGHSVAVILMNENSTPAEFRDNAIFILVYNRQKSFKKEPNGDFGELQYLKPKENLISPSLDAIRNHVGKKQGKLIVSFKMDTYEGKYFSKVMTMDKSIFNKYIEEHTITLPIG